MDPHDHRTRILRLLHHERDRLQGELDHLYRRRLLPALRTERNQLIARLNDTRNRLEHAGTRRRRTKNKP